MKRFLLAFTLWSLSSISLAAVQLCWVNPTQNVDGSALTDLVLVTLHWGTATRTYTGSQVYPTDVPGDSVCTNVDITPGDYFFAATAEDADGNTSAYSNEVLKTSTADPGAPWQVAAPTQANADSIETTLLAGVTGEAVTVTWAGGGLTEIQLVEYGKDTPLITGSTSSGVWQFVPTRAGLYEFKMRESPAGQWYRSTELGFLFFFKLASAGGGGID